MTTTADVAVAVQNGNYTADAIAAFLGRESWPYNAINGAVDEGLILKERRGRKNHYSLTERGEQVAANMKSGGSSAPKAANTPAFNSTASAAAPVNDQPGQGAPAGAMPVDRDYDFDREIPSVDREYVAANGEWQEINALIDARETIGRFPRFLVGGPTGCGKTTLAETIAAQRDAPLFTLQMRYSVREKDLVGSPSIINGDTIWNDGTLTKALIASRDRPVVLLVDEANRARPESKSILFSALDHRCRIVLDGPRGGELIQGNPMNLIVIATINEGSEYFGTQKMDMAEKRRFGARYDVDYLGVNHPDREAKLIEGAAGVPAGFAAKLVETANAVRSQARDNNSGFNSGVPTSAAISWAQAARAFEDAGVKNPVMAAAMSEVVRPFYDGPAADNVMSTIETHLDGSPVAEFDAWNDDTELVCDACGHRNGLLEAEEAGYASTMLCPDCDGDLRMVESGN